MSTTTIHITKTPPQEQIEDSVFVTANGHTRQLPVDRSAQPQPQPITDDDVIIIHAAGLTYRQSRRSGAESWEAVG